jgi:bifunctional non-homologous end joining protein LigD
MSPRTVRILGRELRLSNLDKVLYPETGFSKAAVLDYYRRAGPWILPHLRTRPLTLKRYPDGVQSQPFYEKRCPPHRPDWMPTVQVQHGGGKKLRYCTVTGLPSLMWVANMASLELHVLLSRGPAPERPTAVVFDLDPGPPAGLLESARVSLMLHRVLGDLGLESFAKVSGKKGVHCYVPLNTPYDFDQTKQFAHTVAQRIQEHFPDRVVSRMAKAERKGKVFIDWSQNDRHKTTVCPYSLRGGPHPTVSAPVDWREIERAVEQEQESLLRLSPEDTVQRLQDRGDLFAPVLSLRQDLPGAERRPLGETCTWQSRPTDKAAQEEAVVRASLEDYSRMRDMTATPEPGGAEEPEEDLQAAYVIQKHAARHLHYDLRLECGGVLLSWAVPKGPSPDPKNRHLAVHVEDHPLAYARFEGRIPEGQYGAGHVIVWDSGTYDVAAEDRERDVREGVEAGKLVLRLHGVKLHGWWRLVRTQSADESESGKEQWLLMKKEDEAAYPDPDPREAEPYSPQSGLWLEDMQEEED